MIPPCFLLDREAVNSIPENLSVKVSYADWYAPLGLTFPSLAVY